MRRSQILDVVDYELTVSSKSRREDSSIFWKRLSVAPSLALFRLDHRLPFIMVEELMISILIRLIVKEGSFIAEEIAVDSFFHLIVVHH